MSLPIRAIHWLLCGLLSLVAWIAPAAAASPGASAETAAPKTTTPADPLGRDTPFSTVSGFLRAMDSDDAALAVRFLYGSQSAKQKWELAQALNVVLDRGALFSLDALSRQPEGRLADGLDNDFEQVGTVNWGDGQVLDIVLERHSQASGTRVWLFSAQTLRSVVDAAEHLQVPWGERIWSKSMRERKFLWLPLFMWINGALFIVLTLALAWLASGSLRVLLNPLLARWFKGEVTQVLSPIKMPVRLLMFAALFYFIGPITATIRTRVIWNSIASVLAIVALGWLLLLITQMAASLKGQHLRHAGHPEQVARVELTRWALSALLVVASLYLLLRSLGVDVSTVVAGLGVGGIALAFGAQKSLGDLFGTLTVIGEQALRVGDTCKVGDVHGQVENIGLRSTRIRTLQHSVVSIPNGQLATLNIENMFQRRKFLLVQTLRLRQDTGAVTQRKVLDDLRSMLIKEPLLDPATVMVHFVGIGDYALHIEFRADVLKQTWGEFREVQTALLLRVLEVVEAGGARLAKPAQINYLARDRAAAPAEPGNAARPDAHLE